MIDLLILANLALAILWGIQFSKDIGSFAGAILYGMHAIFFSLMPYLYIHQGMSIYWNAIDAGIVKTCLFAGAIGITTIYWSSRVVLAIGVPRLFTKLASAIEKDTDTTSRAFFSSITFFAAGTYVSTAVKYGSWRYITENLDYFSLMMSRANSNYFLNVFSSLFIIFAIYIIYIYGRSQGKIKFTYVAFVALMFAVLAQPGTRSWAIILLLSVLAYNWHGRRVLDPKLAVTAIFLAPILVVLLNVLNSLRVGKQISIAPEKIIGESFSSFYINFLQFENALNLINLYSHKSYEGFWFLFNSLNPMVLVPRALWPIEKPRADKDAYLTEQIFGDGLDLTYYSENSTLTYTIPISGYADIGLLGVIGSCIFFGSIVGLSGNLIVRHSGVVRLLSLYFLISISAGYRLSVETAILNLYVTMIFIFLFGLFFRKYGERN